MKPSRRNSFERGPFLKFSARSQMALSDAGTLKVNAQNEPILVHSLNAMLAQSRLMLGVRVHPLLNGAYFYRPRRCD